MDSLLREGARPANVGLLERLLSTGAGAKLVLAGLSRRSKLGMVLTAAGGYLAYRGLTGRCRMYQSMGVSAPDREIRVLESITVQSAPEDLYAFWRDLRNFPRIMRHVAQVEVLDERRSRWRFKGPGDIELEWEALITQDVPNRRLEWASVDGGYVQHRGGVEFIPAPGDRGTIVRVNLGYWPFGGPALALFAKLFRREPSQEIREDLKRFKQVIETGEVADSRGPSARQPRLPQGRQRERMRAEPAEVRPEHAMASGGPGAESGVPL